MTYAIIHLGSPLFLRDKQRKAYKLEKGWYWTDDPDAISVISSRIQLGVKVFKELSEIDREFLKKHVYVRMNEAGIIVPAKYEPQASQIQEEKTTIETQESTKNIAHDQEVIEEKNTQESSEKPQKTSKTEQAHEATVKVASEEEYESLSEIFDDLLEESLLEEGENPFEDLFTTIEVKKVPVTKPKKPKDTGGQTPAVIDPERLKKDTYVKGLYVVEKQEKEKEESLVQSEKEEIEKKLLVLQNKILEKNALLVQKINETKRLLSDLTGLVNELRESVAKAKSTKKDGENTE